MKKKQLDLTGVEPEVIDEYIFELMADRLNAERQIIENQKLLDDGVRAEAKFKNRIQISTDVEEIAEYEAAVQNNHELQAMLHDRNKVLDNAIKTFDEVIERLRS